MSTRAYEQRQEVKRGSQLKFNNCGNMNLMSLFRCFLKPAMLSSNSDFLQTVTVKYFWHFQGPSHRQNILLNITMYTRQEVVQQKHRTV